MNPKKKDLRNFGLIWTIIFVLITFYPLIKDGDARFWALIPAGIFLALGLAAPNSLKLFYKVWIKFGDFMGNIISKVILTIVFYLLILPLGLVLRLTGKDFLRKHEFKKSDSYWVKREDQPGNMKYQF